MIRKGRFLGSLTQNGHKIITTTYVKLNLSHSSKSTWCSSWLVNLSSVPNISKPPHHPSKSPKNVGCFPFKFCQRPKSGRLPAPFHHFARESSARGPREDFLDSLDSWIYPTPLDRVGLDCPPGWCCSVCVCSSEVLWFFLGGFGLDKFWTCCLGKSQTWKSWVFKRWSPLTTFIWWETSSTS